MGKSSFWAMTLPLFLVCWFFLFRGSFTLSHDYFLFVGAGWGGAGATNLTPRQPHTSQDGRRMLDFASRRVGESVCSIPQWGVSIFGAPPKRKKERKKGRKEEIKKEIKKKLDHGWPESRTSQARSAQRCRMRSFSLHFVKQARDSTRQGALRKLVGASWSAQVALRKLHCASCSAQVAPRKLLRQVGPCKLLCAKCAPCKLLCASCSVQVALCKLLCVSCSAQVALGKALCANWSVQVALRQLRKMQVASCDARPRTREESNP